MKKAAPKSKATFATAGISYNVERDGYLIELALRKAKLHRVSFSSYCLRLIKEDLESRPKTLE